MATIAPLTLRARPVPQALGLWARTHVVRAGLDSANPVRGVFNGHVEAWRRGRQRGCRHLLVLEDDASFEQATAGAGFAAVDSFLAASGSTSGAGGGAAPVYDLLLLGWYSPVAPGERRFHRQVTSPPRHLPARRIDPCDRRTPPPSAARDAARTADGRARLPGR